MNNPSWRSEDGQLLRSLREDAGIDELVFARSNTVSLAQLRELELGGNSSFYNPAIKRSTGVKLLKKLGHQLPLPAPVLRAEAPSAPAYACLPTTSTPEPSLPPVVAFAQAAHRASPSVNTPSGVYQQPAFWFLCFLSAVALLFFQPWAPKDHPPALSNADPANATPALLKASATPTPSEVLPSSMPPAPVSESAVKASDTASSASCDWQHRDSSKTHTPSQPLKPGNYVYLEAQADTHLCVIDSQNQKTLLQLKAGMTKSVYGSAPFLVHSQDWLNFKLFFQGRRVHEALTDMQHLVLNSQPL